MSLREKIIVVFLIITLPTVAIGGIAINQINQMGVPLENDLTRSSTELATSSKLDSLAGLIRYYDEVLTQAARNYALTQNIKWKNNYLDVVPKLDAVIKSAIDLGDDQDKRIFKKIDSANLTLVDLEMSSLGLVDKKQPQEAIKILDGQEYQQQKEIYKLGLTEYVEKRGADLDQAISISTNTLKQVTQEHKAMVDMDLKIVIGVIVFSLLLILFLENLVFNFAVKPLLLLKNTMVEIANGNLQQRIDIKTGDELEELANVFNQMVIKLEKTNIDLNEKTKALETELMASEKANKIFIGRELEMAELKEKIKKYE